MDNESILLNYDVNDELMEHNQLQQDECDINFLSTI